MKKRVYYRYREQKSNDYRGDGFFRHDIGQTEEKKEQRRGYNNFIRFFHTDIIA